MEKIRHNHIEWLREITHDDSINRISQQADIPYATLYKRFKSNELATDEIIAIARSYGINPVDALVKTGVVSDEEASGVRGDNALRLCNIESIASEIVRRNNEKTQLKGNAKLDDAVETQSDTTVGRLNSNKNQLSRVDERYTVNPIFISATRQSASHP